MLNPDFRDMLSALSAEGVEYLIVGAYALAAHGFPRATKDIDVWVRPTPENAVRAARALLHFGAPAELVRDADLSRPGLILQLGVPPTIEVDGLPLPVIGPRDLVRNKRATGRRQDALDADRLEGLGDSGP